VRERGIPAPGQWDPSPCRHSPRGLGDLVRYPRHVRRGEPRTGWGILDTVIGLTVGGGLAVNVVGDPVAVCCSSGCRMGWRPVVCQGPAADHRARGLERAGGAAATGGAGGRKQSRSEQDAHGQQLGHRCFHQMAKSKNVIGKSAVRPVGQGGLTFGGTQQQLVPSLVVELAFSVEPFYLTNSRFLFRAESDISQPFTTVSREVSWGSVFKSASVCSQAFASTSAPAGSARPLASEVQALILVRRVRT
jgi:hypothetical protein